MEILFYTSGILCIYSYFLYPLILILIPAKKELQLVLQEDNELPTLSLIVAVHNEEGRIREKLENTLQIDYPKESLEIVIASDFSTDATDSIIESYADKGIQLVRADKRKGKEYAQLCAIKATKGDIIVFSDVATNIPSDALRLLTKYFTDERVGAVSSEDQLISSDGQIVGEGAYVKYEMWLRRQESVHAGLVGLSGSFFAARREVCKEWDIATCSDFNTGRNCAKNGMVAISCPDIIGIYKDIKDPDLEYRRKIRTVVRGITAIAHHPEVLNPFNMGMFSFQLWSHKIMRWGVPWFMLFFAIATLIQQGQGMIYTLALIAQTIFYGIAIAGWLSLKMRENAVVRIIFFFVQTNLALAQATLMFLFGKRMTVWSPSQR